GRSADPGRAVGRRGDPGRRRRGVAGRAPAPAPTGRRLTGRGRRGGVIPGAASNLGRGGGRRAQRLRSLVALLLGRTEGWLGGTAVLRAHSRATRPRSCSWPRRPRCPSTI